MSSAVLDDDRYRVPGGDAGGRGLPWLRARVARFSDGSAHTGRRALIDVLLSELVVVPEAGEDPTVALLRAMGLPERLAADVAVAAAAYQPHLPQSPEADDAVERLIEACGARNERTAARLCILLQAHGAVRALVEQLRTGTGGPPVPRTRRIGPDGVPVEVDLSDAPFGRGPHACPGQELAHRLAEAAAR